MGVPLRQCCPVLAMTNAINAINATIPCHIETVRRRNVEAVPLRFVCGTYQGE